MGHVRTPTFGYRLCPVPGCGRRVGCNGFAWVAHMRAHVRKGEAEECAGGRRYIYRSPATGKRLD